jgi:hypothetical protein
MTRKVYYVNFESSRFSLTPLSSGHTFRILFTIQPPTNSTIEVAHVDV